MEAEVEGDVEKKKKKKKKKSALHLPAFTEFFYRVFFFFYFSSFFWRGFRVCVVLYFPRNEVFSRQSPVCGHGVLNLTFC